MLFGASCL